MVFEYVHLALGILNILIVLLFLIQNLLFKVLNFLLKLLSVLVIFFLNPGPILHLTIKLGNIKKTSSNLSEFILELRFTLDFVVIVPNLFFELGVLGVDFLELIF